MSRPEAEECLLEDAAPSTAGDDERSHDFRYIRWMAREEARQVRRRVKRVLLFEQLNNFVLSSQAVPVAVGFVFGSCLKNNVDAFVSSFVAPSIAAIGSLQHLRDMHFTVNHSIFPVGVFVGIPCLRRQITILALFYLIVVPMSMFTSLKYVPLRTCEECASWVKETAKRCPSCGQPTNFRPATAAVENIVTVGPSCGLERTLEQIGQQGRDDSS